MRSARKHAHYASGPCVLVCVGCMPAALKPIDSDFRPIGNKAAIAYKTTPQGDLKINLFFPPDWGGARIGGRRSFLLGGSCRPGVRTVYGTAEYFRHTGSGSASAEYRIESIHHTPPRACAEDGKSAIRWLRITRAAGDRPTRVIGGLLGCDHRRLRGLQYDVRAGRQGRFHPCNRTRWRLVNPAFGFPDRSRLTGRTSAGRGRSNWRVYHPAGR